MFDFLWQSVRVRGGRAHIRRDDVKVAVKKHPVNGLSDVADVYNLEVTLDIKQLFTLLYRLNIN